MSVYAGVLVASAATAAVHDVDHLLVANGASVAQTAYVAKFGALENSAGTYTTPTTGVQQSTIYGQPLVIHPGNCIVFNEFWTGRTTSSVVAELTAGLIVR